MKRLIPRRGDLVATFVIITITMEWMGATPKVYHWFAKSDLSLWSGQLKKLMDGNSLINLPVCLWLIFATIMLVRWILKDRDFRWWVLAALVAGEFCLNYNCKLEYARILPSLDYRGFLSFLLYSAMAAMAVKLAGYFVFYIISKVKDLHHNAKDASPKPMPKAGFTSDDIEQDVIPENLTEYAKLIADRLMTMKMSEMSYAVGITGEWGVGKTTFLGQLKDALAGRAEVVSFNPWMCRTPEQLTRDFFASLRHQLAPKYSSLSKPISEYAKYLGQVKLMPKNWFGIMMSPGAGGKSLEERKNDLSKIFAKLPNPVVVIIDDIDRLESDEVFEVLRLIRNTADLRNTIYLVAYDKEYVTSVLQDKKINDPAAYLEKIFPVELHLPKVEDDDLWATLRKDIDAQNEIHGNFTNLLFSILKQSDRSLILRVLTTYRRVKRFTRLSMLNIQYTYKLYPNEFKILDLFWIELLQMYDKLTYDVLANHRERLLYFEGHQLRLRYGIFDKSNNGIRTEEKFEDTPFWKPETPAILDKVFGRNVVTKKISVCYAENFDKYFVLNVSKHKISIAERKELLASNDPEAIVDNWIKADKYPYSIAYQLSNADITAMDSKALHNYLTALLYYPSSVDPFNTLSFISQLVDTRYDKKKRDSARSEVESWINKQIKSDNPPKYFNAFINRLYRPTKLEDNGRPVGEMKLLIASDFVKKTLGRIMEVYLKTHDNVTALDILNENSELGRVFRTCCVCDIHAAEWEDRYSYEQVAFDIVIQYFRKKKKKPTLDQFDQAFAKMFSEDVPEFDNPQDENEYWSYMFEQREMNRDSYFGTDGSKLNKFKEKCFIK